MTDKVFRWGNEVVYICVLALMWLVFSLPIVTIGAATAGVYACLLAHLRDGNREYVRPFWRAFRSSLRTVTWRSVLLFVLAGWFAFNSYFYFIGRHDAFGVAVGITQGLLSVGTCVIITHYLSAAGRHHHQELAGRPPTVRDATRTIAATPGWSALIGLITVAIPVFFIVAHLWQFIPFVIGLICYGNAQVLARCGRQAPVVA